MPDATFGCPDLTMFCRLDELGLEVVGQQVLAERTVLACRVVEADAWCARCGELGSLNRPRFYAHFLCWEGWRDAEQVRREHQGQGGTVGPRAPR
jgi:hypothetical protein